MKEIDWTKDWDWEEEEEEPIDLVKKLKKNDLFWYNYGDTFIGEELFRVNEIKNGKVYVHALAWSKKDSIFIKNGANIRPDGKISKFKAYFLL